MVQKGEENPKQKLALCVCGKICDLTMKRKNYIASKHEQGSLAE